MRTFYISYNLGDIIYSLPTIQKFGGGNIIIGNPNKGIYYAIKSLLQYQSYITDVKYIDEVEIMPKDFINLDHFKLSTNVNKEHLVNLFLTSFDFEKYNFDFNPWLNAKVTENHGNEYAVINVTSRYRDKFFDWRKELKFLSKNVPCIFFMGTKNEFDDFREKYAGRITVAHAFAYWPTKDLLEASGIILHAKYFSGNQSSLMAIRQGLGLSYRMEQSPNHVDCNQFSQNEIIINPISRKIHMGLSTLKQIIGFQ